MNNTIVITGATGFVGKKLCLELFLKNYKLKILCRNVEQAKLTIPLPAEFIAWDGYSALESSVFEGCAGVMHLAGESVAGGRWTKERKEKILNSRTATTKHICQAIKGCINPPPVLVGASAVGIYGDSGAKTLTEESPIGTGFLADVCRDWEASYKDFSGRLVMLRTGVVLGHGGALGKMILPFRLGAGGRLASGKQWMSWIHIDDLVKMYVYSLENNSVSGAVNAVAPNAVNNIDFTKELAKAVRMPAIFPIPSPILKVIFGEMSSVLLDSQKVSADKISGLKFNFTYPQLSDAFNALINPQGHKNCHVLEAYQWVPKEKETVFTFFSKAENLEVITPPWLNFKIIRKTDDVMKKGTYIFYKLKIKGIPASWKTLISEWSAPDYFKDSQLKGPYSKWEHTHRFISIQGGTLMTDEVIYKAPLGPIGFVVNELMIAGDVKMIFGYRNKKVKEIF